MGREETWGLTIRMAMENEKKLTDLTRAAVKLVEVAGQEGYTFRSDMQNAMIDLRMELKRQGVKL